MVSSLPTEGISGTTVYILPGTSDPSVFTEHIYEDGAWYEIGRQQITLEEYAKKTEVPAIIDDLVTDDATKALSAAQGTVLSGMISRQDITTFVKNFGTGAFIKVGYYWNGTSMKSVIGTDNEYRYCSAYFPHVTEGERIAVPNTGDTLPRGTSQAAVLIRTDGTTQYLPLTWDGSKYFQLVAPSEGTILIDYFNSDANRFRSLSMFESIYRSGALVSADDLAVLEGEVELSKNELKKISEKIRLQSQSIDPADGSNFCLAGFNFDTNTKREYELSGENKYSFCIMRFPNVKKGEVISVNNWKPSQVGRYNLGVQGSLNNIAQPGYDGEYWNYVMVEDGTFYISYYNSHVNTFADLSKYDIKVRRTSSFLSRMDASAIFLDRQKSAAVSLFLCGAKGKHLAAKKSYSNYNQDIMMSDGTIDEGHGADYFYTDKICRNSDDTDQKALVVECETMSIGTPYATLFLYDWSDNLISSFNLSGKGTYLVPTGYKLVVCSSNSTKGTIYTGEPSDLVPDSAGGSTGSILWLGTSIPAGGKYPEDVAAATGYKVYNMAIGSSPLIGDNNALALALSWDEKKALNITTDEKYRYSCYENRCIPYVDGSVASVDAVVFDHAYNDTFTIYKWFRDACMTKGLIRNEADLDGRSDLVDRIDDSWFDWQEGKTSWTAEEKNNNFISSFNFLRYQILSANPHVKIIISSYLENKSCVLNGNASWKGMSGKLICKIQECIARHYGYFFIDMYNRTGWAKNIAMPGSQGYIEAYNKETGNNAIVYWEDANKNISTFQYFCPDGVHPQSDNTGKTRKYLSQLYIAAMNGIV